MRKRLMLIAILGCIALGISACQRNTQENNEVSMTSQSDNTVEEASENTTEIVETETETQQVIVEETESPEIRILSLPEEGTVDQPSVSNKYMAYINKRLQNGESNIKRQEYSPYSYYSNLDLLELKNEQEDHISFGDIKVVGIGTDTYALNSLYFYLPQDIHMSQMIFASSEKNITFFTTQLSFVTHSNDAYQYELMLWRSTFEESMNEAYYELKDLLNSGDEITLSLIGDKEMSFELDEDDISYLLQSYELFDELLSYY